PTTGFKILSGILTTTKEPITLPKAVRAIRGGKKFHTTLPSRFSRTNVMEALPMEANMAQAIAVCGGSPSASKNATTRKPPEAVKGAKKPINSPKNATSGICENAARSAVIYGKIFRRIFSAKRFLHLCFLQLRLCCRLPPHVSKYGF